MTLLEHLMKPCHNNRGMTDTPVAWKFLAETTEPDGQIVRRYCYVAILDRDAARHALTREGWIHQVVQGEGEPVTANEWRSVFQARHWIVRCVLSPKAPKRPP